MSQARLGLLSVAHVHAGAYAGVLSDLPEVEFVGFAHEDGSEAKTFAEAHDTAHLSVDALLDTVHGVVICSENTAHKHWCSQAAEAGVDILCEKPLGTTVETARSILDTCHDQGVSLGVAMPLRFSTPVRSTAQLVREGAIGEVQMISATNRGQFPGSWFGDPDAAGGGAVMDHTVHIVDLVHWLMDDRVSEVYAETGTTFHDIPVEDINISSMTLSDGTGLSLDGSWSKPDAWHFWGDATLELIGTDGRIGIDCFDQTIQWTSDDPSDSGIQSVYWGDDPNRGLLEDFADAVQEDREPAATGADGLEAVGVVEAVYESASRGEPVSPKY